MNRLVLLLLPLAIACSSEKEHPPTIGGGCVSNCGTIGGTSGTDSSVADGTTSDASFEVGEAGVPLLAKVTFLGKYPGDPAKGLARSNVTVRAQRVGVGTTDILVVNADGSFTLDGISPSMGIPTWFTILEGGVAKGYVGLQYPWPADGSIALPLFDDTLPVATAVSGTITAGNGSVVVHVTDGAGKRLAGVTAAPIGSALPYYDSGSDSVESTASATGANGTVVFLGIPIGSATVTLTWMGKPQPSITVPTGADATSWIHVAIE
jgi:hypothetical protein